MFSSGQKTGLELCERRPEVHTFYLQIIYDFMTDSGSSRVKLAV
jgi:hypothetical protein